MEIIGGTFGVSGTVSIDNAGHLCIAGAIRENISKENIASVTAERKQSRQFGVFYFLLGTVFFGGFGWFVARGVGAIFGLAFAVAGAFVKKTEIKAEIKLADGRSVTVNGWHYEIQRLVKFASSTAI